MKYSRSNTSFLILFYLFFVIETFCLGQALQEEKHSFQKKKKASIEIANTEYDFGEVIQGEKLTTAFSFRNSGKDTLDINIKRIVPNIKYIIAVVSDNSFGPGEEGTIKVTIDTSEFYGRLISRIIVSTNDEKKPEIILTIEANIKPILVFKPPFVFIGQLAKEALYSGSALLVGKLIEKGKLNNLSIITSSPAIEAKIQNQIDKKGGVLVKFTIKPEFKAGTFKETITVISKDSPARAELQLLGQKLGIIKFTPDRMEFFWQEGAKPESQSVIFECEKPFKIIKVENNVDILKISVHTIEKGKKYRLIAKVVKQYRGNFLGVVKVYTNLKEHPLIHIPVIGKL